LSKTLYKTLAVYRGIEKSGNKVLINKLKTLETSKNKHFIEEGNNGSYVLLFERNKTVTETDNMVDKGIPVGTRTVFDFSEEQKSILQNNNKGIPFSDGDQVTHEMEHQYDDDQGKNADFEDNTATDPAEIRGVNNENIERNLEGEEERTTYGGKEINPNKLK